MQNVRLKKNTNTMISKAAKDILKSFPKKKRILKSPSYEEIISERKAWEDSCEEVTQGKYEYTKSGVTFLRIQDENKIGNCIVYIHGGGFVSGSIRTHFKLCKEISTQCQVNIILIEYSLSPEKKYPAAINEVIEVINTIKSQYKNIFIAGDSSGCSIAVSAAQVLENNNEILVKGLVLISPWLDITMSSRLKYLSYDPLVSFNDLLYCSEKYAAKNERENVTKSIYENKNISYPKTLILTGSKEILKRDSKKFYNTHRRKNKVILKEYKNMWHVWVAWLELDESKSAIQDINNFINETT